MGIRERFAKGYLAGKRGDEGIARLEVSREDRKRDWSPIGRRFEVRPEEEISEYREYQRDGRTLWDRATDRASAFVDIFRQRFTGDVKKAEYRGGGDTIGAPRGEYRQVAYTAAWSWGNSKDNYAHKYDLKVTYWIPPNATMSKDIGRHYADEAFRQIPRLAGTDIGSAQGWHGFGDNVILMNISMERPPDMNQVYAEFTYTKDGNQRDKWGPRYIGESTW
jgi:hypothetical protein